jgi:hypothetical protein
MSDKLTMRDQSGINEGYVFIDRLTAYIERGQVVIEKGDAEYIPDDDLNPSTQEWAEMNHMWTRLDPTEMDRLMVWWAVKRQQLISTGEGA